MRRTAPPLLQAAGFAAACFLPSLALAVNGAYPGGNGVKNAAMGGASIALPLDATAAANNPAGMAWLPSSATLGLQLFRGQSSADYVLPGNRLQNSQTQPAPEGGFNWKLSDALSLGVSFSGAGAGSDYGQAALPVPGAGKAETTLRVAEISPSLAWKPRDDLSVGVALSLAWQQFETQGVVVPAAVPGGLLPLPSHGQQTATGVGLRAGLLWQPDPAWTLGLSLKTRSRMGRLDGYEQDLLAFSEGRLDLPAQVGVGLAWKPNDRLTLAFDALRILWGGMKAMQDPQGFAWRDQPVWRIGAAWQLNDRFTLRAGHSRNRSQISADRTVQNLLVPSIHEKAWTLGLSWQLDADHEFNLGYELNPRTTLRGSGASAGTHLTSKVQMLLLGYHHHF